MIGNQKFITSTILPKRLRDQEKALSATQWAPPLFFAPDYFFAEFHHRFEMTRAFFCWGCTVLCFVGLAEKEGEAPCMPHRYLLFEPSALCGLSTSSRRNLPACASCKCRRAAISCGGATVEQRFWQKTLIWRSLVTLFFCDWRLKQDCHCFQFHSCTWKFLNGSMFRHDKAKIFF